MPSEQDEMIIACVTDALNTWARESGVQECLNPYEGYELRNLVHRLWSSAAAREFKWHDKADELQAALERAKEA